MPAWRVGRLSLPAAAEPRLSYTAAPSRPPAASLLPAHVTAEGFYFPDASSVAAPSAPTHLASRGVPAEVPYVPLTVPAATRSPPAVVVPPEDGVHIQVKLCQRDRWKQLPAVVMCTWGDY